MTPPSVLTIAGSDPSGGAGIQADLRVFAALGVAGLSAVTALTVQNSRGVLSVHPVAPDILAAQLDAVLTDSRPSAVKIGMLGGAAQVSVVADALRRFRPPHVVLDPVLASTGGVPLLDDAGRRLLLSDLLPLCELVTPNVNEAEALTDLWESGAGAILVKGGHRDGPPTDVLTTADGTRTEFSGQRIETPHTHGTGCVLSAAIAANLALGWDLTEAVRQAKRLLTDGLRAPVVIGAERGYPGIGPWEAGRHAERQARLRGLYVLTDTDLRPDRSAEDIVRAALDGGAKIVQLREKKTPLPTLIEMARRLANMAWEAGALFIVNDRVDVALASDADGVHLGPDDMHPRDARRLLGPNHLVGISVSSVEEAAALAPFASYLGVGAIFGTSTKSDAGPPVGVERIAELKAAFPLLPVVAIGGIGAGNIGDVVSAGADAAAVVSAVVAAPDMRDAVWELRRCFDESILS